MERSSELDALAANSASREKSTSSDITLWWL
jgi:hypothetical protein